MEILVIYSARTRRIRRMAGPLPLSGTHVGKGEAGLVVDTTIPKHVHELQALVVQEAGPLVNDTYRITDASGTLLETVVMDPDCGDADAYAARGLTLELAP